MACFEKMDHMQHRFPSCLFFWECSSITHSTTKHFRPLSFIRVTQAPIAIPQTAISIDHINSSITQVNRHCVSLSCIQMHSAAFNFTTQKQAPHPPWLKRRGQHTQLTNPRSLTDFSSSQTSLQLHTSSLLASKQHHLPMTNATTETFDPQTISRNLAYIWIITHRYFCMSMWQ